MSDEHPVGLKTRNVFLDTEVFLSNKHNLNTNIMKLLGRYVADGIIVLHTTDVTLREVSRQIGTMESELTNQANKVARDLKRWNDRYCDDRHRLPVPDPLCAPAEPSDAYRDFEWILCQAWSAQEHRSADLLIGPVLDRYFNRRAPFDKKGSKEFPDAFALLAIDNWCASKQESMYVVSRDKAVGRAAAECDHLIGIDSIEDLFELVTAAQDFSEAISDVFHQQQQFDNLHDALSENINYVGGLYDGYKYEAEVIEMEIIELEEIKKLTVLRVDQDQASCVAHVQLLVSAKLGYVDVSEAWLDNEDGRYIGGESAVDEVQNSFSAKVFVELKRNGDVVTLSSAQFIARNLIIMDYYGDGYPYK